MAKLLVSNATLVDPSQGLHQRLDMMVVDGVVAEIGKNLRGGDGAAVVDATGLVLMPGFIDLHTHLREPGNEGAETIETGTRAAAAGGFTTIYCMPNTTPVCDSETGVHYVVSRAAAVGLVRVVPIAALTMGSEGGRLTNFGRLKAVGAGAFGEGGRPVMNAGVMRRALEYSALFDVPIFVHCEDTDLSGEGVMHEGAVALRLGLKGIPRTAESIMVARDVALAAATNGRLHIGHVSARESVEAIREAKRSGLRVTAEVTPHHLLMTDEDVAGYNTHAKVKPPLRAAEDRAALRQALEDGTIDCIATSHAPHSSMSKDNLFDHAPFGVIGMESAFPILYTEFVVPGRWTLDFLVEKLAVAPARVVGRPLGTLARGSVADFILVDSNCREILEARHLRSKSANCPFLGREVRARIAATFVEGRAVFHRNDLFPHGLMARRGDEPTPEPAKRRKDKAAKEKPGKDKKKNRRK